MTYNKEKEASKNDTRKKRRRLKMTFKKKALA